MHKVTVHKVFEENQSAFLKKPIGVGDTPIVGAEDEKNFLSLTCTCEFFFSNGSICPCVLAVAASKFANGNEHLDLPSLLEETVATHRGPGRPRTIDPGNCYGSSSSSFSAPAPKK